MPLVEILLLALIPTVTMTVGASVALRFTPGDRVRSAIQHFTAGVVLAAVADELLPQLTVDATPVTVIVGFAIGVGAMFLVERLADEKEEIAEARAGAQGTALALIGAVGIDALTDGLLLGLALSASESAGAVLVVALSLEMLFLALATAVSLKKRGVRGRHSLLAVVGLAFLVPSGALIGALVMTAVPSGFKVGFLAFGVAALLYLVIEELMREAHEGEDTPLITLNFFIGFMAVLLLDAFVG